jgi:hypothetical protein
MGPLEEGSSDVGGVRLEAKGVRETFDRLNWLGWFDWLDWLRGDVLNYGPLTTDHGQLNLSVR